MALINALMALEFGWIYGCVADARVDGWEGETDLCQLLTGKCVTSIFHQLLEGNVGQDPSRFLPWLPGVFSAARANGRVVSTRCTTCCQM